MNVPNILTGIRFMLIGVFIFVFFHQGIPNRLIWAFGIFLIAGLTDLLDGFIARRYNMVTKWGKLMDPLADKLLLVTVLTCLSIVGTIPYYVIIIVAFKELMMVFGAAFLYRNRKTVVQANFYGKAATVLFYLAITAVIFVLPYSMILLAMAVVSTLLAFVQYYLYHFRMGKKEGVRSPVS